MDDTDNEPASDKHEATDKILIGSAPNNAAKGKKKKWSRSGRKKQQQQTTDQRDQRGDNREIVKHNEILIQYYKEQKLFKNDNEFDVFLECLKSSLPASFRINTFDFQQGQLIRQLVDKQFQEFLLNEKDKLAGGEEASEKGGDEAKSDPVPTLECLKWYPREMAWQMNMTRIDFRKSAILRNLHKFIQAETDNGFVSRQEAVSMIPPLVLDVKRGQTILDMCAAPGSKTAQLLEYLAFDIHGDRGPTEPNESSKCQHNGEVSFGDGLVVANDVDNKRCYMLVHQASRLNSPNCVIINEDASRLPKMKASCPETGDSVELKFDRILCDAPCSGDGTVRKNPDVWRKWTIGNGNNLHGLQCKILRRGVELLKENGLIVYSTCSMNPVEDEAVVANILRLGQGKLVLEDCSRNLKGLNYTPGLSRWTVMDQAMQIVSTADDVKPERSSQLLKSLFSPSEDEVAQFNLERCVRLFPHHQNTGAFFVAVIRKLSSDLPHEKKEKPVAADANATEEGQRHPQPKPKRRRYGFKEDPFIFLDSEDSDWKAIKDFYGLPDNFPVHQLTHRCSSGKKRSIYLVSQQTRNFINANQELPDRSEFIKVINGGMRLFMKAETESGFRICQDGINEIVPYIRADLKVSLSKEDLIALLAHKAVPFDRLSSSDHLTNKLRVGTCVLIYQHSSDELTIEMPLVAWRGERSLALYVSNTYKLHLRSLIEGQILAEELTNQTKKETVDISEKGPQDD